jgi:hypothetical protein
MPVSMTERVAEPASPARRRPQHLSLLALGAGAGVAALVVAWLVLGGGSSGMPAANGRPAIASQAQLERFARTLDYPLYWAGPKPGFSYELTAAKGRVWVRYLPAGVSAGDSRSDFLVVGTYKQPHSYANLQRAANRSGGVSRRIAGNGLLVFSAAKPTSVYFSFPGADYQVEVYTHSTKTARSLVLDGTIEPVTQ